MILDKKALRKRINDLAVKYRNSALPAEKCRLKIQISELFCEYLSLLSSNQEIVSEYISDMASLVCCSDKHGKCLLDKFAYGENFVSFTITSMNNKKIDQINKNGKIKTVTIYDNEEDDESYNAFEQNLEDKTENTEERIESENSAKAKMLKILPLMSELQNHLNKKQDNPNKRMYYQMFYTENITALCKQINEANVRKELYNNETLIFKSLNEEFLDHVMEDICRTITELSYSEYKQRKYFGINQSPEERISPKFDLSVYTSFFQMLKSRSISKAAISMQRDEYDALLKKILFND